VTDCDSREHRFDDSHSDPLRVLAKACQAGGPPDPEVAAAQVRVASTWPGGNAFDKIRATSSWSVSSPPRGCSF